MFETVFESDLIVFLMPLLLLAELFSVVGSSSSHENISALGSHVQIVTHHVYLPAPKVVISITTMLSNHVPFSPLSAVLFLHFAMHSPTLLCVLSVTQLHSVQ